MDLKNYIVPIVLLLIVPIIPWFEDLKVGADTCNTLFCAVGVLFSVSMSLIIAFNTKDVTDKNTKGKLRNSMRDIRDVLIVLFVISLLGLLVLKHVPDNYLVVVCEHNYEIPINIKLGYSGFVAWYIFVLLINYKKIHNNYEELEDSK